MKVPHMVLLAALAGAVSLLQPDYDLFAQTAPAHKDGDGHNEGDGHKHDDEGHGHSEDEHKGEKHDLGKQKMGAFEVEVTFLFVERIIISSMHAECKHTRFT